MKILEQLKKSTNNKVLLVISLLAVIAIMTVVVTFYNDQTFASRYANKIYNVVLEKKAGNKWEDTEFSIKNNESKGKEVVLRVNYNEIWSKVDNNDTYTIDNNVNGENVVEKTWTLEFLSGFHESEDGWYYYNKTLKPNETIRILRKLQLKEDLIETSPYKEDYQTYDYDITFNYEVLEADKELVKEVWNRDVRFEKDRVIWRS